MLIPHADWVFEVRNLREVIHPILRMRLIKVGGVDQHWIEIMKKVNARSSSNQNQSGQDLVEFALVLPILLLVIFGVLDLGRLFHSAITVTNSARVGARLGALRRDIYNCTPGDTDCLYICDPNCGPDYFINVTKNEALDNGIDLSSALVEPNCIDGSMGESGECDYGDTFRVKVTYDFDLIIGELIGVSQMQIVRSVDMLVQ